MAKYTGDALMGVGLAVQTDKPLDDRLVVNTKSDIYKISADYAYEGMPVTDASTGNIYVLLDKSRIKFADGWSSSYEAINFIPCTLEEYKILQSNTTADYQPIDESIVGPIKDKPNYLLEDAYYYIYEDSLDAVLEGQEYLKLTWGKEIEARISAINNSIAGTVDTLRQEVLKKEYATEKYVADHYIPLTFLEGAEGGLNGILSAYYTKNETDEEFVHKSDLLGDAEDETDYKFVTAKKYKEDQEKLDEYHEGINQDIQDIQNELANTIKSDSDGSLDSLVISHIKSPKDGVKQLTVDVTSDGLFINKDKLATKSEISEHITLTFAEYNKLLENGQINEDVYYHIIEDESVQDYYVRQSLLQSNYSTTSQVLSFIAAASYTKKYVDDNFQKIGNYVSVPMLNKYYSIEDADLKFQTKEELQNTLKNYVTLAMLGDDSTDGKFIFVKQSDYLSDKEELQNTLNNKLDRGAFDNVLTTKQVIASSSVNTPKIINSTDVLEIKEGVVFINDQPIALVSEMPKLVTLSQEEYNALEEKQEDVYYYIYDTDEDLAWVTYDFLNKNYYTKSGIDSKIQLLITEGIYEANTSYCTTDEYLALQHRVQELEQQVKDLANLIVNIHPIGKFDDSIFDNSLFA